MNAKRAWSVVCLVIAVGLFWPGYQDVQAHDYPLEQVISRFLGTVFYLIVGIILWLQGREKKEPIQSATDQRP